MNTNTREFLGGQWTWWEPGQIHKESLASALEDLGFGDVVCRHDTTMQSLRTVMKRFINLLKVKQRGKPIEYASLERPIKGLAAVQRTPNDKDCDYETVISCAVVDGEVKVVKYGPLARGVTDAVIPQLERQMTIAYQQAEEWMPEERVNTTMLTLVLKKLDGFLCRQAGIVDFVPGAGDETLAALSDKIQGKTRGFEITTETASLGDNERTWNTVLSGFSRHISKSLNEIQEELAALETAPRANGQQARLAKVADMQRQISQYESILGTSMDDLRELANSTESAVNQAAVAAMLM